MPVFFTVLAPLLRDTPVRLAKTRLGAVHRGKPIRIAFETAGKSVGAAGIPQENLKVVE
jgi:flagella basal body P-ring formation protein FlgA